jgi:hypothetical protein
MVLHFREKTTTYILVSFFLLSDCYKNGGIEERRADTTASYVVSINSSIKNPLNLWFKTEVPVCTGTHQN